MALSAELTAGRGPHLHGGGTYASMAAALMLACCLPLSAGLAVFGLRSLWVVGLATVSAGGWELVVNYLARRRNPAELTHSLAIGVLVGLTLPATASWPVPVTAAAVAIVLAKGFLGGLGHYVWHPALVGRVIVGFLMASQMGLVRTPGEGPFWPFLARGHLITGDLDEAARPPAGHYAGWALTPVPDDCEAWLVPRPIEWLGELYDGTLREAGEQPMTSLVRDLLPPWSDTLVGLTGGGIGEVCAVALMAAGLYLVYRGYLRWELPVAVLVGAALAAAVLPVRTGPLDAGGSPAWRWLPGFAFEEGLPVGLVVVLYHLTCGELMLVAFLLAGDWVSSPITRRGTVVFGLMIGALTIWLRLSGLIPTAGYWAVLIANTAVPLIDRRTRRRVLGT